MSVNLLNAQSSWRTYVSPDKSFSVDLPITAVIQRHTKIAPDDFKIGAFESITFLVAYSLKSVAKDPKANLRITAYRHFKPITAH